MFQTNYKNKEISNPLWKWITCLLLIAGFWVTNVVAQVTTINYSGTIVNYTVPPGVTSILIDARGAEGGLQVEANSFGPGKGARIVGTLSVTPGQILKVLVGGKPANATSDEGGGGGGGSFVTTSTNTPIIIAGGGGGMGADAAGIDASITNNGTAGNTGGAGGTGGNGGAISAASTSNGSGGGGLLTDGADACAVGKGKSFLNGGAGGSSCGGGGSAGGFGGGGGGSAEGAGGGGGYSGGGGGDSGTDGGGGGGSFNSGTNPANTAGFQTGNGLVIITPLFPCATPPNQPTGLVLTPIGPTILGLSFTAASGADSYLVVRYPTGSSVTPPVDGTSYTVGGSLGLGTVVSNSSSTSFNVTGLAPGVTYDIYVYSMISACIGTPPTYLTPTTASGTATTPTSVTASATGGLWSSVATWGGALPGTTDPVVIPAGAVVTVDQVVTVGSITVNGVLQWNASSNAMTIVGGLTIGATGRFLPYTTGSTGQTINIGGNFTNNGYCNLAVASTLINFNGSQQVGGSAFQSLLGTGTFEGDGVKGIIRTLAFQTTGSSIVNTSQSLIISNGFTHTAGSLNTGGKITIDNTAQVYGRPLNLQVANVAVTSMGSALLNPPQVGGGTATLWTISGAATLNTRYFFAGNTYLCTTAGTFDATTGPSHTAGIVPNGTASLLWLAANGTLGNAFLGTGSHAVGTQYYYGGNLYTCTTAGAGDPTNPPVHGSGIVASGTAQFLYVGSPATVTSNYDATTQTVRSLTLVSAGSGYSSAPSVTFNLNGGTGTLPSATAVYFQQIAGPANSLTQKSGSATITNGLGINNTQGASSNSGVGAVSVASGGVNYTVAPSVGFGFPTGINLLTAGGSYTVVPTGVTITGGTTVTGFTNPTFTITANQGQIVSVYVSGGGSGWLTPPTLAFTGGTGSGGTLAFPSGCLATANAVLGSNGQVTNFTVTNAGFGYVAAPTALLAGGTATTAASAAPSVRIALYSLTYNNFTPSLSNVANPEGAEVPANRKLNNLSIGSPGLGANFTSNLEIFGTAPLTLTNGAINMGGNNLLFSWNSYGGTTGSLAASVTNASITLTTRGGGTSGSTLNFPFSATFSCFTGSGTNATNGASVLTVTASRLGAPSGTVSPSGTPIGNRSYRMQSNVGAVYGTNPTITLNFNASDLLNTDQAGLFVAQGAGGITGPWTVRSTALGTGSLPSTGSKATATAGAGPIVPTGDDYFGWVNTSTLTPLAYNITRSTGVAYNSIITPVVTGTVLGFSSSSTDDNTSPAITIPSSTFQFQGQTVTGFNMCTNGWVKLITSGSASTTNTSWINWLANTTGAASNNTGAVQNMLAPFWDDLTTNPNNTTIATLNTNTRYQIIGSTPGSRKIVCEWYNYTVFGAAGPQLNFQVVLDESDNSVTYNYGLFQGFNGTNNHRYTYTCGIAGLVTNAFPLPGQVLAQQYENSDVFSSANVGVSQVGANGLMSIPECSSSIKFTPGAYAGGTIPSSAAPVNDEPAGAITVSALPSFPNNLCGNFYTSRNATASTSVPVCAGTNDDDVWFKFTAADPNTTVRVYGSGGYTPRVQVLDASLNLLGTPVCVVGTAGSQVDANLLGLVTPGNVYYVRVYHDGGGVQALAIANVNGSGAVNNIVVSNPAANNGYVSAATGSVLTARVRVTGGGGTDATGTAVLTGNAVSSITLNSGGYGYTSTPTVTIEKPDAALIGEFAIVVFAVAANNECSTATTLTNVNNTTCVAGQNSRLGVVTTSASASAEASCTGTPDDDVWYKFTATGTVSNVSVAGHGSYDAVFEVWNGGVSPGNCGTKTSILCQNTTGAGATEASNVTTVAGNTYFVRVYHFGAGSSGLDDFDICVTSPIPSCIASPTAPAIGATVCGGSAVLSWIADPNATGYDVYFDAGTSATTLRSSNQAGLTYDASTLITATGTYAWRIVPRNGNGTATGCADWTFTGTYVTPPTVTPPSASISAGDPVSFTASGDPGATFSLYTAATGGTLIFTGPTYSGPGPCTTTSFYAQANLSGCPSVRTPISITVTPIPAPTVGGTLTVCGAASTTLTSNTPSGSNTIKWYDALTGGNLLSTGVTFNTPVATATKTYYAGEENATCSSARTAVTVTWSAPPALAIFNTTNNNTNDVSFCGTSSVPVVNLNANTASASSWAANGSTYSWSQSHAGALSCAGTCTATNSVDLNNILPAFNNEHIILTVSDPVTGCAAQATVDITAFSFPAFNATATPAAVCTGQSTTLDAGVSASNFSVTSITYGGMAVPPSGVTTLSEGGANIVAPSTVSINLDDQIWGSQPIGFNFNFFGNTYNTVNISSNGNLQFTTSNTTFTPGSLPNTSVVNFIAPFWTDMYLALPATPGFGIVRYWTSGFSPNRIYVCDFTNVGHYNVGSTPTAYFTGQVWMYETTGIVEVHIGSVTGNGTPNTYTWSTGVNNLTGSIGAAAPNRNNNQAGAFLNASNEGWRFTPPISYSFAWSSVPSGFTSTSGNPTATPTGSTQYNVLITDPVTGCTKTDNVNVTVNPLPTVSASPSTSGVCYPGGTPSTLTASGSAATYGWTPSAGLNATTGASVNALPSTSTTYTVTATTAFGCTSTATATVNVTQAPTVVATATPSTVCAGSNVQLNAAATLPAGPYCVPAQLGSSCVTSVQINTLNNTPPACVSPFYNIIPASTATTTLLPGSTYTLNITTGTDFNAIVSVWIDFNRDNVFSASEWFQPYTNDVSGSISITVPSGASLGATGMRIRSRNTGNQNGDVDACNTGFGSGSTVDYTIQIGNAPGLFTYNWSTNPTYLTATNISNPVAQNVQAPQTYTVMVTDPSTSCVNTQTVSLSVNALPDLSTSGGGVACAGNPITLSVSNNAPGQGSGNTYAWSTNASTPFTSTQQTPSVTGSSTPSNSGDYTVVVTNSFLCTATAVETVTVNPNPTLSVTSTQNVGCVGGSDGSITVSASNGTPAYNYSNDGFTTQNTTGTFTNLPVGPQTIDVQDDNGCLAHLVTAALTAISSTPPSAAVVVPFIGMPTNVCNGTTATLSIPSVSKATMYIWDAPGTAYFNGNPLNVSPFTTSTPSVTLTYSNPSGSLYVTGVQAANGCGASLRKVQKTRGTVSVPASVSGATTACASSSGSYSTAAVDAASSYLWTITGDATVSGTGTTATVTFGPTWTGGTLCVAARTSCYTSPTKCITISTSASTLNAISGTFTACPNSTLAYSVPASTGAASYTWTLPPGATGSSTTNSINVTYGAGYSAVGSICVSVTSTCGVTSAVKCKTVAPGLPSQPASISGALTGLCNQTIVYNTPSQGSGITYTWTSPGTINTGQGSTSISTTFAALSTGNVCVTASNSCGSSTARCVPVKGAPNAPGAITANPSSWCANTGGIEFTVNTSALTGTYALSWTFPPAAVATYVIGGGNSNSLILDWKTGSGNVNVTASNACGGSTKTSTWSSTCREGSLATVSSISVSPNPTTGMLNINYTSTKGSTVINVLDLAGRVVMTQTTSSIDGANATQIDLSKVAKGAYMLSVQSTQGNKQVRVVVE